jgi:NAD(P)H-dependent FMN reductase
MRHHDDVRILAVCGSLQAKSANLDLLRVAAARAPEGVEVALFDGVRALPHFDPDLEAAGVPIAVMEWRRAIAASDALLVASPEYGHSLPGALKNAIDWVIGSGELERKIVAITAAVPHAERGRRGLEALRVTLGAVSATIVGGDPIVRGPSFEADVALLVGALVCAVTSSTAPPSPPRETR